MVWCVLYGLCWTVYLAALAYAVLFKASREEACRFVECLRTGILPPKRKVHLQLFESTRYFLQHWEYSYARWNIYGNLLLFLPLGLLTGAAKKGWKGAGSVLFFSFILSLGFETIQYLYAIGEFDVDDIMLNVAGAQAGYGLASLARIVLRYGKSRNG